MLSQIATLCMAAALAQAGPQDAWLDAVPADVPIVVRGKSLETIREDVLAMLKVMSPSLAQHAEGVVGQGLDVATTIVGPTAAKSPFVATIRLPDPNQPAPPDWAVIVASDDYAAFLKNLAVDGQKPKALAGYDSFTSKVGAPWFASHGAGWAAFGPDEATIKALGKPASKKSKAASGDLKAKLMAGDVGLYLDIAVIQLQYGAFFEQIKPALVAQAEQANAAQGSDGMKAMLDGVSQILRSGDGLVLSLDFDASAFELSGLATVRPGSDASKSLAASKVSPGELLAKLPGDLMVFVSGISANGMANRAVTQPGMPKPKTSPELEKAMADRMKPLEGKQVMGMSFTPMKAVSLADPADPKAVVKASMEADKARKALNEMEMTIKPDALSYKGFQFDKVVSKFDEKTMDKLKASRPDVPNADAVIKQIAPDKTITAYTGTDGKYFLTTTASTEAILKAQVDAIQSGQSTLGSLAAWKSLRPKFPEKATVLVLVNAQEVVKMVVGMTAASKKADIKPAELPKEPALLGFSLVNSPKGYDFRMIVPSAVGPVLETGLAPLAGGIRD